MHIYAVFAVQQVSLAAETKLWNCFVNQIEELLPCKNTPAIIFSLYFDTVPAISLTFVLLQLGAGGTYGWAGNT